MPVVRPEQRVNDLRPIKMEIKYILKYLIII